MTPPSSAKIDSLVRVSLLPLIASLVGLLLSPDGR